MKRMNESGRDAGRQDHADRQAPVKNGMPDHGNDGWNRRTFLSLLIVAMGTLAAVLVAAPVIGFVLGPIFRRRTVEWRDVGPVDGFTRGETVKVDFKNAMARAWTGRTGRTAAWLQRSNDGEFVAFSLDCTHLGCPVRWEPGARLFMCPCHGGVYYADGSVAGGPPPRPLTRYPVRIRDGRVEIRAEPLPIT